MTIHAEVHSKILRLHFVEQWGVNTIARQLHIHHSVVERVLSQVGVPQAERTESRSIRDPYNDFIVETLNKFPDLTATRLYVMACSRGYKGCSSHFRARVAELRPRKNPEAFLRLRTFPGEEMQCDWGSFGHLQIGRAKRPLMAFVMVLSWSRMIFVRFYLNARMESFLRGHVAAFEHLGVARVVLYDNLKSAVIQRHGDAITFNPELLKLSAHYRFEPRPCAPYRGNEKGRVEKGVRYIRTNFFAAREFNDLDDLNRQADLWCTEHSTQRPCQEDTSITVGEAFEKEKEHLIELPNNPYPADDRVSVSIGKTPYFRYDLNDYSLPHTHVRRVLTVLASMNTVRITDGTKVIASHVRSYGKGEQIEDPAHLQALVNYKRRARAHRGQDRLAQSAPSSTALLTQGAKRGYRPSQVVAQLLIMLDSYGAQELEHAIAEALRQEVPHPNAVRIVLERRRDEHNRPPPLIVPLPANARANHIVVRPSTLDCYDQLTAATTNDNDNDNSLQGETNDDATQ